MFCCILVYKLFTFFCPLPPVFFPPRPTDFFSGVKSYWGKNKQICQVLKSYILLVVYIENTQQKVQVCVCVCPRECNNLVTVFARV